MRWQRCVILTVLCLLPESLAAQNTDVQPNDTDNAYRAIVDSAIAFNQQDQFEITLSTLSPLLHSHDYSKLSPEFKYAVDSLYGSAAYQLQNYPEAHKAYLRTSTSKFAREDDWSFRLETAQNVSDFPDVFEAFKVLQVKWPKFGHSLPGDNVERLERGLGNLPNGLEAQLAFEKYLEEIDWKPADPFFSADAIWMHYALNLLETGDKAHALAVAERIDDPNVLAVMLADRRFDEFTSAHPDQFDVLKAANASLAAAQAAVKKDSHWLGAHAALASAFHLLGQPENALAEINRGLIDASQLSIVQKRSYWDYDEQYDHALAVKAFILFDLGKSEQALGAASTIGAGGRMMRPNTDMSLVTGRFLVSLGRGEDALTQLAPVSRDNLGFDGQPELTAARACAAVQTGNLAVQRENLKFLKHHMDYQPAQLLRAQLCANDLDDAARSVVAGLSNPRLRAPVLQELQNYKPEGFRTSFDTMLDNRLTQLRARDDVAAAVDRVGRINSYPITLRTIY